MANSSDIDAALVSTLLNDATLMGITSDGVYWDIAKEGKTKFVIVSLSSGRDDPMQPGLRAIERRIYLVKTVIRVATGADVNAAAARIDALLDHQDLTIPGYTLMVMHRVEPVRYVEIDAATTVSERWEHRGGLYEVMCSVI